MTTKETSKNKNVVFRTGELRELVLRAIALGLLFGGSIVFPTFPMIVGSILKFVEEAKKAKVPESKIKRVLANLERKEIIAIEEKGEEVYVHIKDKNNISILRYSIKALLDSRRKRQKWNSKWVLVFFDVPEQQRNKRDYLRKFLKDLGFYQYQKSVYLFPYECKNEIDLIRKITEGGKYLKYIIAERIEDEEIAKAHFGLK